MNRAELIEEREYWKSILTKTRDAYFALVDGGVQSYKIDDRELTRLDLGQLRKAMKDARKRMEECDALLNGGSSRKAVAIIPRDW